MQQGSGMFDDDCVRATVLAARRDGLRLASSETGTLANPDLLFGAVASPAPHLKHARSRAVDACCGPWQFRGLRDGLRSETGLTVDGRHT